MVSCGQQREVLSQESVTGQSKQVFIELRATKEHTDADGLIDPGKKSGKQQNTGVLILFHWATKSKTLILNVNLRDKKGWKTDTPLLLLNFSAVSALWELIEKSLSALEEQSTDQFRF